MNKLFISLLSIASIGTSAVSISLYKDNEKLKNSNINTIQEYGKVKTETIELEKQLDKVKELNNYFIDIFNQVNGVTYEELKSIPVTHGSAFPYSNLHKEMLKLGLPSAENLWFYESYISSANFERKVPNWAMQSISVDNFKNRVADRKGCFFNNDTIQVPDHFKAQNKDYAGTGWSRGHMVPAGDNLHSQEAMNQTFLLNTNIVPQDLDNNQNYWYRLESFCKTELVNRYKNVTIISGPVYEPNLIEILTEEQLNNRVKYCRQTEKKFMKYEVIGNGNIAVPNYLFKIILAEPKDDSQQLEIESNNSSINNDNNSNLPVKKKPYLLGSFLIPNEPIPPTTPLTNYEVSLHDIEVKTGLQFFKKLNFQTDVVPLCEDPKNCEMMSQLQLLPRLIGFCRSQKELDELITANKSLHFDDSLNQLIENRYNEIKELDEQKKLQQQQRQLPKLNNSN